MNLSVLWGLPAKKHMILFFFANLKKERPSCPFEGFGKDLPHFPAICAADQKLARAAFPQ